MLASVTGLSTSPSSALSLVRSSLSELYFSSSCGKLYCSLCPSGYSTVDFFALYLARSSCLLFLLDVLVSVSIS